jgi:hypothetical protein
LQLPLWDVRLRLPEQGSRIAVRFDCGGYTTAANNPEVIRSIAFPILPVCLGTASGLFTAPGVYGAFALRSHRSGSGSPVPDPPEMQLLA